MLKGKLDPSLREDMGPTMRVVKYPPGKGKNMTLDYREMALDRHWIDGGSSGNLREKHTENRQPRKPSVRFSGGLFRKNVVGSAYGARAQFSVSIFSSFSRKRFHSQNSAFRSPYLRRQKLSGI